MNESAKKGLIIVVAVAAVIAAGFGAMSFFRGEQQVVEKTIELEPGFQSEKQKALDAQKGGGKASDLPERDLGG